MASTSSPEETSPEGDRDASAWRAVGKEEESTSTSAESGETSIHVVHDIPEEMRDFTATIALELESLLGPAMRDSSASVEAALKSQEKLCRSISRLKDDLDNMLEKTPLPPLNQPASRLSNVHKRIQVLSTTLKVIQKRIDNMNHLIKIMTSSPYVSSSSSSSAAAAAAASSSSSPSPSSSISERPPSKSWSGFSSPTLPNSQSTSLHNRSISMYQKRIKRTDAFPLMDQNDFSDMVSLILSRFTLADAMPDSNRVDSNEGPKSQQEQEQEQ